MIPSLAGIVATPKGKIAQDQLVLIATTIMDMTKSSLSGKDLGSRSAASAMKKNAPESSGRRVFFKITLAVVLIACALQAHSHASGRPGLFDTIGRNIVRRQATNSTTTTDTSSSSATGSATSTAASATSSGTATSSAAAAATGTVTSGSGIVVDPRTPMGSAKFSNPNTVVKPEDKTIVAMFSTMTIAWSLTNVIIAPQNLTIQVMVPLESQGSQIIVGTGQQRNQIIWKDVAVNITGDATSYDWVVNISEGTNYQLRIFDSNIGPGQGAPGPFVAGAMGLSTSSAFTVYMPTSGNQFVQTSPTPRSAKALSAWTIVGLACFVGVLLL